MNNNTTDNPDFWSLSDLGDYVAIDLETTGLDSDTDEIIEIGAVRFKDGVASERFSQLINPQRPLPPFITELTGIRDDDLKDAATLFDVADDFIALVGESQLVGHNIAFDLGFLSKALPTSSHFSKSRTIPLSHDTGLAARFIHPCLDGYGLSHLSQRFKTKIKSCHRATEDAEATGQLFSILLLKLSAIPLKEISTGFRFVEGTASPLANTLRVVRKVLTAGYSPAIPSPDAMRGPSAGRKNTYLAEGDPRPEEPVEDKLMRQLFASSERFTAVMPGYQVREEQIGMAAAAANAFRDDTILIVEAGTGVGKSLAYLVPALLSGRRIVISTHTKNLQDQLFYDEIPRLGELFKFGFTSALLKGRRNYICRTKWKNWALAPERIAAPYLREKAALISRWVNATQTGDISEIGAVSLSDGSGFFNLVVSEPGYCRGRACGESDNCPLMQIRRAALKADLLIVNHSLVMSDLLSEGGILGDFGKIVFDEAHHLEDVATDQFGSDLTAPGLKSALDRINRLCRRKGELWVRLSGDLELGRYGKVVEKAASDAGDIAEAVNMLFDQARAQFESRVSKDAIYSESFRYKAGGKVHQALSDAGAPLYNGLTPLRKSLAEVRAELQDIEEDRFPTELLQELQAVIDLVGDQLGSLHLSLTVDDQNRVYWVEIPPDINRPVHLKSAPLDVSELLADNLWKRLNTALLTSATLATTSGPEGFDHIISRLGIDRIDGERIERARFGSPFDYQNNCLVCYPSYLASPADQYQDHCRQVADICAELMLSQKRNTLILFTSYNAMHIVERELKQSMSGSEIDVLVQGKPGSNERLIHRFRKTKGAVLLGTDSLWEGIDVPGEALQMVVIPRLPFGMPGDPIIAARIDRIREQGGVPFFEYQMPAAILRLRQGSGRLIRTSDDRGVVLVLDPRAVTKGYGARFRQAVPGRVVIPNDDVQLKESIERFFEG